MGNPRKGENEAADLDGGGGWSRGEERSVIPENGSPNLPESPKNPGAQFPVRSLLHVLGPVCLWLALRLERTEKLGRPQAIFVTMDLSQREHD